MIKSRGADEALIVEVNDILTAPDDPPLKGVIESGKVEAVRDWLTRIVNQWAQIRVYVMVANQAAALEPNIEAAVRRWFEGAIGDIVAGLDAAGQFTPRSRRIRAVSAFG